MGIVESTYAELKQQELKNNPYSCLHMADIDINPHQVEAFTFALSSLELGGAILADEVGLGKTIEAGLAIKYLLCSGKNKILLIMPSNLRKQWQVELEEKFDIDSLIVDSSNWEDYLAKVKSKQAVIIVSYHFASKRKTEFGKIAWDFCVFDEAHRLRNVYKNGSKMANSLYELTKGISKILLTATPMQNTLLDIYGLVQFIDDRVFYSKQIFSERYLRGEDYNDLKACLEPVVQRSLRKEVAEYIQFSERKEMTIDFELSPMEIELYVMINNYLKKEILYALPNSHRTLITSVIRKLLASSSMAVAETFKVLKGRLETLKETTRTESADESIDFFLSFFDDDEIETDDDSKQDELYTREKVNEFIQHEIDEVTAIINKAESIKRNAKMTALKQAVETAFAFQDEAGIKQRIVVFTESIRTQQYMFEELSHAGYEGQILKFNGSTNDPVTKQIYKAWKARNYRTYVVQQENEFQNALMSRMEKNSLYSVEYVPSRGRNEGKQTTLFYHNGELCAWLKDTAFLEGKDVVKTTKLSNVWKNDDIPKADLGNEGGVAFPRSKKPEKLIERILLMATNEGDLVLDSFLGSGTTAAVAHKMRRRYIGIELGDHCYTHCKKRLDRVIDGKDRGGVTNTYDWQGGGGYKFYELAEPLLVKNKVLPVYQINPSYTWDMVCEAICKIEGFTYEPYGEFQGHSSENRFIHITEEFVNTKYAMSIMKNLGDKQSLLIYCKKNQSDMILPENVEVKKIPKDLLDKCNFESEVQE